jgi:hypothetical protein
MTPAVPEVFSSFHKKQVSFEIRYSNALRIWDSSGALWSAIEQNFKSLKLQSAEPNRVVFSGDERFAMMASIDRALITDHDPGMSWDRSFEAIGDFYDAVVDVLGVTDLTRVGTRFQYSQRLKSLEEAHKRARNFGWSAVPKRTLFKIEPSRTAVTYKLEVDDGELGYTAQVYPQENKLELNTTPEMAQFNLGPLPTGELFELVLDIDFMTKKPISIESFSLNEWLSGWRRAINQDADNFLKLGSQNV